MKPYFETEIKINPEASQLVLITKYYWMRWVGRIARMGEMISASILVAEPEWKGPIERNRHRGKDNIQMFIKVAVLGDVD
jgi:hypothetical protein